MATGPWMRNPAPQNSALESANPSSVAAPPGMAVIQPLIEQHCTSCHGKLANGKGPNAYDLKHPLPRNLISKEFMNQAAVSDERLYQSILLGVAGTPMPAHDHLKDQTILDIIAFIRANTEEAE